MDTELERDGVEIMGAASQEAGWRSNAWPSHTSMLEAAGLQAPTPEGVPGDGACAYWSLLATMDGGLPRTTFAPGWQPLAGRAADEAARAAMCQLRAQVVQWLQLAPAQRRLLRTEPGCTRSFAQYAAGRLEGCDRRIRDELREQAGIPIGNAGDVVRPHEALSMLERCALLADDAPAAPL